MLNFFVHRQFIESWQKLSEDERDAVHRLLQILEQGNVTPGMRPHKVGSFLSLSPNMDLRIIATILGDKTTFIHVGHHDAAYQWAKQKSLLVTEIGSTEIIDVSELVSSLRETTTDSYPLPMPIQDILSIEDDDVFLQAITEMSPEWQEWLLSAHTNSNISAPAPINSSLVFCPSDDIELTKALKLDIPAWHLFLHAIQREAVDDLTSKSIVITGGPGTGKTVVLLNRILSYAPKGKDEDCSVLLTYSADLATYLQKKLKAVSTRYISVYPIYLLGGKIPDNVFEKNAFKTVRFEINQGRLYKIYKDRERIFVRELLVDELQDITPEVSQILQSLIASGFTKVIVAADLDQTIYNVNQKVTSSIIQLCEKKYELAYCYRSTRQIIEKAAEWLSTFNIKTSNNDVFALSGPSVRFLACKDSSHQVEVSANVMRDLQNRYDQNSLALIYCQYSNPSFKGLSKEVEVLKKHPELKYFHHFANTTKGKEYFAGVLFISDSFLKKDLNIEEKRLRINTLYVALTRFRDEVTVVYPKGCAIEPYLKKINQVPEDKTPS